jgi:hypothetical protein
LSQNTIVHFDKPYPELKPGMIVPVRLLKAHRFTLTGEYLG